MVDVLYEAYEIRHGSCSGANDQTCVHTCCCLFQTIHSSSNIPYLPTALLLQTMNFHFIGFLAAVRNLTVHSQWSSILLIWTPPFSLDITGVDPDFWYCVKVYNISEGRAPLSTNCSVYEPQFCFTAMNHSSRDLFEFRVFAVNAVGNGTLTSVNGTFHASKYIKPIFTSK